MPKHRLTVTNSELGTFRTCRRKWWLAYEERLTARMRPRYFSVGSAVHEAADQMYRLIQSGQTDERKARNIMQLAARKYLEDHGAGIHADEWDKTLAETEAAVDHFVGAFFAETLANFEIVDVEIEFHAPVYNAAGKASNAIWVRGKIDVVARDIRTGELLIVEHKTTAGAAYELELRLDVDPQVTAYCYAMSVKYGEPVRRVRYQVVRKKAIGVPERLKNGAISAKKCDTTQAIYREALDMQTQAPSAKQIALLESLPETTSRWAYASDYHVSEPQMSEWREDVLADGWAMRQVLRGKLRASRNGASCRHVTAPECLFRAICLDAPKDVVAAEYDRRLHRHPELDGEDVEGRRSAGESARMDGVEAEQWF